MYTQHALYPAQALAMPDMPSRYLGPPARPMVPTPLPRPHWWPLLPLPADTPAVDMPYALPPGPPCYWLSQYMPPVPWAPVVGPSYGPGTAQAPPHNPRQQRVVPSTQAMRKPWVPYTQLAPLGTMPGQLWPALLWALCLVLGLLCWVGCPVVALCYSLGTGQAALSALAGGWCMAALASASWAVAMVLGKAL